MASLSHIWHIIVETNTLNFIVFLGIIVFICAKINLPEIISKIQKKVEKEVKESESAKSDSENNLKTAKNKMEKVPKEVEQIITDAENTAKVMSEQILEQGREEIEIIENNTKKILENDILKTKRNLLGSTAKESIALLEKNINQKLSENKELHQKYIDEAINELEGIII